jgi:predicted RNA-binding Zn-ribbon protein involved in translation (DUF1610 family)
MFCTACGSPLQSAGASCPSCGEREPHVAGPQQAGGWQDVGRHVSSRTVTLVTNCQHCGEPVPVNGPAQSARCPHCDQDATVPVDVVVAILTAGDHAPRDRGGRVVPGRRLL